jgi:hypothetical protein
LAWQVWPLGQPPAAHDTQQTPKGDTPPSVKVRPVQAWLALARQVLVPWLGPAQVARQLGVTTEPPSARRKGTFTQTDVSGQLPPLQVGAQ